MESATPLFFAAMASFSMVAAVTLTAFIKISVVLLIVRNAIGLQQIPSNIIVMALSMFIAIFISMPVFSEAANAIAATNLQFEDLDDIIGVWQVGIAPFREFLTRNVDVEQLDFFVAIANQLWAGSGIAGTPDMMIILVPAFVLSELTEAFKIGFLLYLPFIAIDLAVTAILMALGMQQVMPNIISTPFKLLLFVFVEGWTKLIQGMIMSYGV